MKITNLHQAKTQLSKLVNEAMQGEVIIIAKAGKPVAKLIAYHADTIARKPGYWRGQVTMSPDFNTLPKDIVDEFYGES